MAENDPLKHRPTGRGRSLDGPGETAKHASGYYMPADQRARTELHRVGVGRNTKKQGYKKYVKEQMKKLMAGTLVSGKEAMDIERETTAAASRAQAVQGLGQKRATMAQTGGSPLVADVTHQSAAQLGEAQMGTAVKASGQAKQMVAVLEAQRKAQVLAAVERQIAGKDAAATRAADTAFKAAEVGAEIAKTL